MFSFLLLFLVYSLQGSSNAVSLFNVQNETLTTVLVLSDGSLLVGTTSRIIRLNSNNLTENSSLSLNTTTNRLLLLLNDTGLNQNVLSCQENECFLFDSNDLTTVSVSTSPNPSSFLFPATPNMPGLYTGGSDIFVGRDAVSPITSSITKLRYSASGSQLQLRLIGKQQEGDSLVTRAFLTNFHYNGFAYFVFVIPGFGSSSTKYKIQVARICSNDTGIMELQMLLLTTYTEAELQCNEMRDPDSITSATFVHYNGKSMILVSMSKDMDNIICAFNITEINTKMDDKLSSCKNGQGTIFLKRNSGNPACVGINEPQKSKVTVCNRPGQFINPLEVDAVTYGERLTVTSNRVSSMNSLVYQNIVYLYAGSDGTIEQFYFSTANYSLNFIRSIPITIIASVNKISFSSDGEYLYTLSPNYVVKRPVNVCNNFTSCDSCTRSGDPICGWCVLSSMCTKSDDCTTSPAIWQNSTSQCPRINNVSPAVVYTDQLMSNTPPILSLNVSNVPGGILYSCVYTVGGEILSDTDDATIDSTNETVTCALPLSSKLPHFNGEDTILSVVSLKTNGVTIISLTAEQQVAFTNCSTVSSCSSCLSTKQACNWCPFDNNCISPHTSCVNMNSLSGSAIDNCPLIRGPNRTDTLNYLVHVNLNQSLVIQANNLQLYNNPNIYTVQCILNDIEGNELYTLSASVNTNSVNCKETVFNVSLNTQSQLYEAVLQVRVSFANKNLMIDNLNDSKVVFYSCSLTGENCGQCLSIESKFQCGYCKDMCIPTTLNSCSSMLTGVENVNQCEPPVITNFSPISGHIYGGTNITIEGTNLGADVSQVESIKIGDVVCQHIANEYRPGKRVVCRTDETRTGVITDNITITFTYGLTVNSSNPFQFLLPSLNFLEPAVPSVGPLSGGTHVLIKGRYLGIGNTRSITLAGIPCTTDRSDDIKYNATELNCTSQISSMTTTRGGGTVRLIIDGRNFDVVGFDYENDPVYSDISPQFFFKSGGTNFTISGKDLNIIQCPKLIVYYHSTNTTTKNLQSNKKYSEICTVEEVTTMRCTAPLLDINATNVQIGLEMDNVTALLDLNVTLTLYPNPLFETGFVLEFSAGDTRNITINGMGFYFLMDQVTVKVGELNCAVKSLAETKLICEVEIPSTATSSDQYSVIITVGNYKQTVGEVSVRTSLNLLTIIGPAFAVLVIFIIVIFIVVLSVFYHKYKQKDKQNDRLVFELERLESSVAYECKLGFAELQTDLGELVGDLTGTRLPYHDLHTYLLQSLFPGSKDHPTLHPPQFPTSKRERMEVGLRQFYGLLMDKIVLLNIVHTLEAQKQFNIRDKSNFGSLLMIALHNRLDYATEILKRLLSDLVRRTVAESYPKLLLRRTESVAEKMLSSWLAFTLHGYVVEHTGQPLYLLYKAVKAQLEKGPIDVITGEARYSLSEQKLVRQQLDIQVINATIETEDGLLVPVKLIDCDSVSQAKEKMLDAVFKNAPVSQRPQLSSIDIEYRRSPTESYILRDEDGTNISEYGWRRINTLRHYRVYDRATFRLIPRKEIPAPGNAFDYTGSLMISHGHRTRTLSDNEDGTRIWHLFKQVDEDPRSLFTNKKMVTEIYLPRMLSTKTILQQFVDDLFSSIFTLSHPPTSPSYLYTPIATTFATAGGQLLYAPGSESLPLAIKYLFDLLDDEATCAKISDTDVVHTWKNNALALRFWVNLIKNPEFVFDINKSAIVDSCLSVIAQAFIDGCSSSDTRPTINSPTSKLLYNKEVQDYKNSVKLFYEEIQALPRIPDDMMMQHLRDMSTHQAQLFQKSHSEFNIESAVYEILRYATKYQQQILQSLRTSGLEAKAQIFEAVLQNTM